MPIQDRRAVRRARSVGPATRRVGLNPVNVRSTRRTATKEAEHSAFSSVEAASGAFLESVIRALEPHVDSTNKAATIDFFNKLARDTVVRAKLLSFAANTVFSTTIKALTALSETAPSTCTAGMTPATHNLAQPT